MIGRLDFAALQRAIDGLQGQALREAAREYAAGLESLRDIIRKRHDRYAVAGELRYEDMVKYGRLESMNEDLAKAARKAHVGMSKIVRQQLRRTYRRTFGVTLEDASEVVARTIRGTAKPDLVQAALQTPISGLKLNERLLKNRRNLQIDIQEAIGQGLQRGETYGEMSMRLKDAMEGDLQTARATVRTEIHRVQEQAKIDSLDHAEKQGARMAKWWLTSEDERVREPGEGDHVGMGEKYSEDNTIPYDEDFVNDETGGRGPAPGHLGMPEDDVNCRCRMIIDILEYEPPEAA